MISSYKVRTWHARTEEVKEFIIPWQEACAPGDGTPKPHLARLAARRRLAESCGEEYDWVIHHALSIEEVE